MNTNAAYWLLATKWIMDTGRVVTKRLVLGSSVNHLCTGIMLLNGGESGPYHLLSNDSNSNLFNVQNVSSTIHNIIIIP